MTKRTATLSAVLALALAAAGCSSGGKEDGSVKGGDSKIEAPYELAMAVPLLGAVPKDMQLVMDEVNKIAQQKINVTVKLTPISWSAYQNQINLMMTGGEKLDLLAVQGNLYANYVAKGQLLALDDLIDKQGKAVAQAVGPVFMKAPKIKGKTYAVPTIRDFAQDYGYEMRKDLVTKYNIDLGKLKTLNDLDAVFKTIKDDEPNMAAITNKTGSSVLGTFNTNDILGDGFGVLLDYGQKDLKVVNWFETPEYAETLKTIRRWYQAGYVLKDAATNKEADTSLIKAGKAAGNLGHMKPGFEVQNSKLAGTEIVVAKLAPAFASTSTVTNIMWGVSGNSKNPEKAMQFLNLLYSDKDIVNLFDWGIEGKHYVKTNDDFIDYPAGVDVNNSGYNLNMGWMFGNQYLSYLWKGDDKDVWSKMKTFNDNALKSKALGFTFDSSAVKTEFTAVTNVVNTYKQGLECGVLDPEKELPKFIAELKAAGIDRIIAEKQKQLDAWAKENNVK